MTSTGESLSANDEDDLMGRTWKKMENDLQKLGFREGALKGQEESYQTGFDIGYSEGFRIGEIIGFNHGFLSSHKQLNTEPKNSVKQKGTTINTSDSACILCSLKKDKLGENSEFQNLTGIISKQKDINNKIVKKLKYNYENGRV